MNKMGKKSREGRINWYEALGCKKTGWILKDDEGREWEQVTTFPTLEEKYREYFGIKGRGEWITRRKGIFPLFDDHAIEAFIKYWVDIKREGIPNIFISCDSPKDVCVQIGENIYRN